MRCTCCLGLLVVVSFAGWGSPSLADGLLRRRVLVVPAPPPVVVVPAAPVVPAPVVPPAPLPPPPAPVRPPTIGEFAASFQPAPGTYQVTLLHPLTGCPVPVCFTLPPGCPCKVRVQRRELEFDYGRREVEIRFERHGGVRVNYH